MSQSLFAIPGHKVAVFRRERPGIPVASISAGKQGSKTGSDDPSGRTTAAGRSSRPPAPSREISSDRDEIVVVQEHMDEALASPRAGISPQVAQALGAFGVGGRAREDPFERGRDEARTGRSRPGPRGPRRAGGPCGTTARCWPGPAPAGAGCSPCVGSTRSRRRRRRSGGTPSASRPRAGNTGCGGGRSSRPGGRCRGRPGSSRAPPATAKTQSRTTSASARRRSIARGRRCPGRGRGRPGRGGNPAGRWRW